MVAFAFSGRMDAFGLDRMVGEIDFISNEVVLGGVDFILVVVVVEGVFLNVVGIGLFAWDCRG